MPETLLLLEFHGLFAFYVSFFKIIAGSMEPNFGIIIAGSQEPNFGIIIAGS